VKLVRIAALAALALATLAFAGVLGPAGAHGSAVHAPVGGITVSGSGSVTVTPDRAGFAFGVVTQAQTAAAALSADSAAIARVLSALEQAGIAKADTQTAEVSLSPRTNDKGDAIVGYTASNTVSTKLHNLDKAGAVIDTAVAAGADTVSGPNLFVEDQTSAYRTALAAAVVDARAKAQALAAAAGVALGRVTDLEEGTAEAPVPLDAGAAKTGTPIEPGTQSVGATVKVTFALG